MREFMLQRDEDASGVSGTGIVALGTMFESSGKCVLHWETRWHTIGVYDSIEEVEEIHGHEGRTRIVWLED